MSDPHDNDNRYGDMPYDDVFIDGELLEPMTAEEAIDRLRGAARDDETE